MTPDSRTALDTLIRRIPALAALCRIHSRHTQVGVRLSAWAWQVGLITDENGGERLRRVGFDALAARAFSEENDSAVLLFAQWLTVLLAHDDRLDDGPAARSASAVDEICGEVLSALRDGAARPRSSPVTRAMVRLWQSTAPRTGPAWRRRFLRNLTRHWQASRQQAINRHRDGPAPHTYPTLRRRASGPFYYDLVEPILGVELPAPLARGRAWRVLTDATGDIVAWCNDIASLDKDIRHSEPYNYVLVAERELGLAPAAAIDWVCDRIAARVTDLKNRARALPAEFARLGLDPAQSRAASKVACVLLGAPRGTIEWLLLSERYSPTAVLR